MPAPKRPERAAPAAPRYSVALEPVISALDSLMMLNSVAEYSGLGEWIVRTGAALPPEVAHRNRLVLEGLHYAVLPERRGRTFPEHVDDLAATEPTALRDRLLGGLVRRSADPAAAAGDQSQLLASADAYLAFLRRHLPWASIDEGLEREVFPLLRGPREMQDVIVSHLRWMWDEYLAAEWRRCAPLLQESVDALREIALKGLPTLETVRAVTGHELLGERQRVLGEARDIVFVPSLHIGPYLDIYLHDDLMWLVFGARLPEGGNVTSEVARSELLVRLDALADDTRLRILALLGAQGELCSQDIMTQLHLTQSATSRHLRQLSAAGYVAERRREAAKCFSLNRDRVTGTLRAVERFMGGG